MKWKLCAIKRQLHYRLLSKTLMQWEFMRRFHCCRASKTLTDKEYQIMRNASMAVLREIGVETGGSNIPVCG